MQTTLARLVLAEYGDDLTDPRRVRGHFSALERDHKIRSAAHYVGAVRRLAARVDRQRLARDPHAEGSPIPSDGRLIGAAWNHLSPTQFLGPAGQSWVSYWRRAAERPDVVGSSRNPTPEAAFAGWLAHVPPKAVRFGLWRPDYPRQQRSLVRLRRMIRAAGRRSIPDGASFSGGPARHVTASALDALGRLSPELQRAALTVSGYYDRDKWPGSANGEALFTSRDLDWPAIARVHAQLVGDPSGRVRAAWSAGRSLGERLAAHPVASVPYPEGPPDGVVDASTVRANPYNFPSPWLCPSYPNAPVQLQQRVVRGETPQQIVASPRRFVMGTNHRRANPPPGIPMSRAEAHQWLLEGGVSPIRWLQGHLLPGPGVPPLRDDVVIRWLGEVRRRGAWDQLTRERTTHGPAGIEARYCFLDRVDEIQVRDLARGIHTRVEDAFRAAAERVGEAFLSIVRADFRVLAAEPRWRLLEGQRWLTTNAELAREGDQLRHCVGTYGHLVTTGRICILSQEFQGHRSTVEFSADGHVLQHRGPNNGLPHALLEVRLQQFMQLNAIGPYATPRVSDATGPVRMRLDLGRMLPQQERFVREYQAIPIEEMGVDGVHDIALRRGR